MPSRERVVTTITTSVDEDNGEGVVVSESFEVQPAPCPVNTNMNTAIDTSNAIATPVNKIDNSPSPSKKASKSNAQKRKKKSASLPSNQRTLGSFFFKPKGTMAKKPKPSPRVKTVGTSTSSSSSPSSTAVSTPERVTEKVTATANATKKAKQTKGKQTACASKGAKSKTSHTATPLQDKSAKVTPAKSSDRECPSIDKTSSVNEIKSTPTSSSTSSSTTSSKLDSCPETPMDDIMSIVLGAHGDTPMKTCSPPKSKADVDRANRHVVDDKAILPTILSHRFVAKPRMKIRSKRTKAINIANKESAPVAASECAKSLNVVNEQEKNASKTNVASSANSPEKVGASSCPKSPEKTNPEPPSSTVISTPPSINIMVGRKKTKAKIIEHSPEVVPPKAEVNTNVNANVNVNELQPRKKAKVNELQPRKKVKGQKPAAVAEEEPAPIVNELQPRKKSPSIDIQTTSNDVPMATSPNSNELAPAVNVDAEEPNIIVNTLQPRKKKNNVETNPDETKSASSNNTNQLETGAGPLVNELTPRRKGKDSKAEDSNPNGDNEVTLVSVTVNQLKPRKKRKVDNIKQPTKKAGASEPPKLKLKSKTPKTDSNAGAVISGKKAEVQTLSGKKQSISQKQAQVQNHKSSPSSPDQKTPELSEQDKVMVSKYDALRSKYVVRAEELISRALSGSLPEEDFQMDTCVHSGKIQSSTDAESGEGKEDIEFQDDWVEELAVCVQGSPLPVEDLAKVARSKITPLISDEGKSVSIETVSSKIKLIAERTQYLAPVPGTDIKKVDIFSDTNPRSMWRWELISLDYLPDERKSIVKKARAARKKLKKHQNAVTKLVQALIDIIASIQSFSSEAKKKKQIAKVSSSEEGVLKYEREEEKSRLLNDAKKQKELEKQRLLEERRKEKERQEEMKKAEKASKLEAKRKKQEEAVMMRAAKEEKQKSRMLSFFKKPSSSSKQKSVEKKGELASEHYDDPKISTFNSLKFWSTIGEGNHELKPFACESLSTRAIRSKKRKIGTAKARVFIPTVSDNPFDQQVYDEERTIRIRNRYKYLSFREDFRPPYHGTWSKPASKIISGRNPFAKDTSYLDYDIDSEAEWEEGDDEQGEDCSENGNDDEEMMDDEEGDTSKYNYQDGWLAEDSDLIFEDDNGETHELRRKAALDGEEEELLKQSKFNAACVIGPLKGGIPQSTRAEMASELVEGIEPETAGVLSHAHQCEILSQRAICLDPFPVNTKTATKKTESASQKSSSQQMSQEDLITFARFVHNSSLTSKDMVVEELRNAHQNITSSRAQAIRKLDSIATKRRLRNSRGVVWEVKNEVLQSLGLDELIKVVEAKEDPKIDDAGVKEVVDDNNVNETNPAASTLNNSRKVTKKKDVTSAYVASPTEISDGAKSATNSSPSRKRKASPVSKASINLLASFLKKKKTSA